MIISLKNSLNIRIRSHSKFGRFKCKSINVNIIFPIQRIVCLNFSLIFSSVHMQSSHSYSNQFAWIDNFFRSFRGWLWSCFEWWNAFFLSVHPFRLFHALQTNIFGVSRSPLPPSLCSSHHFRKTHTPLFYLANTVVFQNYLLLSHISFQKHFTLFIFLNTDRQKHSISFNHAHKPTICECLPILYIFEKPDSAAQRQSYAV